MSTRFPILDLRSAQDFRSNHLKNSANVPFDLLERCWHELPPKGSQLQLVSYDESINMHQQFLEQHGYNVAQTTDHSTIEHYVESQPESCEQGIRSMRLWSPNPVLEQHFDIVQTNFATTNPVTDIGCGAGRDSIFLAQHGYTVTAIDNHDKSLQRLKFFAERAQTQLNMMNLDCEANLGILKHLWGAEQPQLILQSRYLYRPLFDMYHGLAKGSMIVIHTFLEGAAKFGSPKRPQFLLKDNELAERFSSWNILLDDIHHLDDGRPLAMFIAQK